MTDRLGRYREMREDIAPKSVGLEKAQTPPDAKKTEANVVRGVKITHPDRIVYPALGFTKLDLARYYDEVGERIAPHLANRPLTLVRCPDGADKPCFYQRHLAMGASPGAVKTFKRLRSSKGYYIHIDSHGALITLVQNGAVEMHTWGARVPDAMRPDRITMDLDPDEDLSWEKLVRATEVTRTLIDGLGLKCFLKTTGGKGLHVVLPVQPKLEWAEVKAFSRLIAEFLVRAEPKLFTTKVAKVRREGKVLVDYLRNSETASAVAAFSARARPDAGVSMPIAWDELQADEDIRKRFTVQTAPAHLRALNEDPWADYVKTRQSISASMWRSLGKK